MLGWALTFLIVALIACAAAITARRIASPRAAPAPARKGTLSAATTRPSAVATGAA